MAGAVTMRWLVTLLMLSVTAACDQPARAQPSSIAHPDNRGARIEYFAKRPAGRGPWPAIVLLHGHQQLAGRIGGLAFANWGELDRLAKRGYLAVAISLPGYGRSTGPEDFAGPYTQHAVHAVIARLEADRLIVRDRIVIEGISLGAITGALVAAHGERVAGLVLISGLYDLPVYFATPRGAGAARVRAAVDAQTGGGRAALAARSVLPLASRIDASTLILNGAIDDRTDPIQARRLAEAINASGGRARVHIYDTLGHEILFHTRKSEVDRFIDETLRR